MNEWMDEWMNVWIYEWMNEWTDEWMNEWIDEWMNEWTDACMNEWTDDRINEWTDEWMYEVMNGWMDEWMNWGMDEWMKWWMDEWMTTLVLRCKVVYINQYKHSWRVYTKIGMGTIQTFNFWNLSLYIITIISAQHFYCGIHNTYNTIIKVNIFFLNVAIPTLFYVLKWTIYRERGVLYALLKDGQARIQDFSRGGGQRIIVW